MVTPWKGSHYRVDRQLRRPRFDESGKLRDEGVVRPIESPRQYAFDGFGVPLLDCGHIVGEFAG